MRIRIAFYLLFTCFSFAISAQEEDHQKNFIRAVESGVQLDTARDENFSSFYLPDSTALKNKVFFTGENHRFRGINSLLELKMFKYLHEKANVNVFMMEFGFSRGYLINHYVTTGDSITGEFLRRHSYLEYWNLYKSIRDYYTRLPEDKKFKVVGVDLERELTSVCKMIHSLLDKHASNQDSLDFYKQVFRSINGYLMDAKPADADEEDNEPSYRYSSNTFNLKNTFLDFKDHFKQNTDLYKTWLGTDFDLMSKIVSGAEKGMSWDLFRNKDLPHQFVLRETYMYQQIMALSSADPNTGFYGQFGRCHTPDTIQEKWCESYVYRTLASRLNLSENENFKGKVYTIGIYYFEQSMTKSSSSNAQHEDVFTSELQRKIKEKLTPGLTLVSLDRKDSISNYLKKRFDMVVMYKPYSESAIDIPSKPEKSSKKSKKRKPNDMDEYFFMGADYMGLTLQNSSGLRGVYAVGNATFPSTPLQSFGLELGGVSEEGYFQCGFGGYIIPEQRVGDTLKFVFTGFKGNFKLGANITRSSKVVICPYFNMAGGNHSISISKTEQAKQQAEPYFGTREIVRVSNPALWLGAGVDGRIFLGNLYIKVSGGYDFDLSRKSWFTNGGQAAPLGSTRFNGRYIQAGIGFRWES